jgi:dGTPase
MYSLRDDMKTIREQVEDREYEYLSPYAAFSKASKGRDMAELECDIRPVYQRDRDRILHSKAFRRLRQKTQVFLLPKGDHYRTRLTHTLEVSQNARTIAKALRLNEDLVEAIALGHDLGHTPFGHAGEKALNNVFEFKHSEQSVRVVEYIEHQGRGLNLTKEVRDGLLNHQTKSMPKTLEGQVLRLSDKIAYINHDIEDAIRGGILRADEIPYKFTQALGDTSGHRIDTLVKDVIINSMDKPVISMSEEIESSFSQLREFLYDNIYHSPIAKQVEEKARNLVEQLYHYLHNHFDIVPRQFIDTMERLELSKERTICDYIAGMTDNYAIKMYEKYFIPQRWEM